MATVHKRIPLGNTPPAKVWDVIQDIGAVHTRLAPGFVVDTTLEPHNTARQVKFVNGLTVRELIVTIDHDAKRLAYAVSGSGTATHHNASFQVFVAKDGSTELVWITDLLPDSAVKDY